MPSRGIAVGRHGSLHADRRARRRGFTLLEFEVALVVLGITLSGVLPLVVMHSRGVEAMEKRYSAAGQWYVSPSPDAWARKLGACALLAADDPGPIPKPTVAVVDEGDPGYRETGSGWTGVSTSQAFQGNLRQCAAVPPGLPPASAATATWTFTGVAPGWYYVEATWLGAAEQTAAALYAFYDGSTLRGQAAINQQIPPAGPAYQGSSWQVLAKRYFASGTAGVQLTAQGDGYVAADGMLLVPAENDVQILSLDRSFNSQAVTVHVSVTVAP
jgi:prepilin-type N-terminal cleavage/methylation domain-containing protein